MVMPEDKTGGGSGSPATRWLAVAPSNTQVLSVYPRAIAVEVAGNIVAEDADGNIGTFVFTAGEIKAIRPVRIRATGTTATGILALY